MTLSADNICKSFGRQRILRDCTFTVEAGQCSLLRGPSGTGKSTLLRILALLESADAGSVFHGEKRWDATRKYQDSPYPFLTVVFQQIFLWPNLTMGKNLSIALTHRTDGVLSRPALEMLERLAISHVLEQRPHECSLGQRQRLALARALLSRAQFLLLDEPSSALDKANLGILVAELKEATCQNRGVLIVTHDDRGFEPIADQCLELEDGILRRV